MKSLEHLMYMGTKGYVTNNEHVSLVTKQNIERLKGVPILFISGADNVVYTPETTERSYTTLTNTFNTTAYEREVFQGYGHLDCWMSPAAAKDIYPSVHAHAVRSMRLTKYTKGQVGKQ